MATREERKKKATLMCFRNSYHTSYSFESPKIPRTLGCAKKPPDPGETVEATTDPAEDLASDGRPRRAELSIPALGVGNLVVEPYRGRPDDAPGTRLQDTGIAASPHGPRGGVGPGGVGNYLVTAHRTSSCTPVRAGKREERRKGKGRGGERGKERRERRRARKGKKESEERKEGRGGGGEEKLLTTIHWTRLLTSGVVLGARS